MSIEIKKVEIQDQKESKMNAPKKKIVNRMAKTILTQEQRVLLY